MNHVFRLKQYSVLEDDNMKSLFFSLIRLGAYFFAALAAFFAFYAFKEGEVVMGIIGVVVAIVFASLRGWAMKRE